MKEILKLVICLSGYFAVAPLLGWALSRSRIAERAALCALVFMTSWYPTRLTMMLNSVEFYRGHTKGFEFSLLVGLGIALTACAFLRRSQSFRAIPPGVWMYLAYCALSCVSLIPAINKLYGMMAAWKFVTALWVFVGAYHAFRDDDDLKWVLRTLAGSLLLQAFVCLKMRFFEGRWQVHGWFEHQNPLCMWAYMCALPLLAMAFSPLTSRRDTWLYLSAVGGAALVILLAVSRAGLAAFVVGSIAVTAMAFLRGVTFKKLAIAGIGVIAAVVASAVALDSLKARVQEDASRENEEDLRLVMNRQCRAMLDDSAIGIGWNNFGVVNSLPHEKYVGIMMEWSQSLGFRIYDENYYACPLTESLYWLLLAENGYPGFLGYLAFLALTLGWGFRALLRHWNGRFGSFAGGVLVALALTYAHGSVERCLTQTKNLSAWLIFSGFVARMATKPYARKLAASDRIETPSLLIPALS